MTIILVGNKKDLAAEREVSYEEGVEFAKRNKLIFFETSAKSAENVDETFTHATNVIFSNVKRGDVYDLVNDSIGIKPGNANSNINSAAAMQKIAAGHKLKGDPVEGTEKKKKKSGDCC